MQINWVAVEELKSSHHTTICIYIYIYMYVWAEQNNRVSLYDSNLLGFGGRLSLGDAI